MARKKAKQTVTTLVPHRRPDLHNLLLKAKFGRRFDVIQFSMLEALRMQL
jgi:hypothetical protein